MCFGQILTVFSLIFQKFFSLTLHKRTHVDKSKLDFQCHVCEYASYSKKNLRGHIQLKHSDKTKYKHVCEYCGEKFLYPHLLEAHHVIIPLLFKSQSKLESKQYLKSNESLELQKIQLTSYEILGNENLGWPHGLKFLLDKGGFISECIFILV